VPMGRKNPPPPAAHQAAIPSMGSLWPVWAVLVACAWIAFSPALANGFVDWDDTVWIVENRAFQGLGWAQFRFAFTSFKGGVYQPLGWLLQSLTYAIYGLEPYGYHLVSVLFHAVNVVLVHLLSVRLVTRSMPEVASRLGAGLGWLCGIPVLLYAVHPLRVEMVAWASPQAYLPSITLSLLATLAYLKAHPSSQVFRRSWMIGSSVLVALAVLTKGSAVVLPFVFLILDAYPLGRLGSGQPAWPAVRKAVFEKSPILVFCLAFTAVAFVAKALWLESEANTGPLWVGRIAQASFGIWFYLAKTAWPFGLSAFYPRPEGENFQTPLFAASFVGVALAVSAAVWFRKEWPWLLAALAAYLVIVSPYLGLVRVGVPLVADRYGHGPIITWAVLGCAGLCRIFQRRWPRPVLLGAGAGALALACGLIGLCQAQCRVWGSNERLWKQALGQAGWSADLHDIMGSSLTDQGKIERAVGELHEALRIRPRFFEATYHLGVALNLRGDTSGAIACFRKARTLRPKDARVHLSLGGALMHQGNLDEAVALYREGVRLQPDFANLHFSLGVALLDQREVDEAIKELTKAAKLRPWHAETHSALAGALALRGRLDDAVIHYREALQLDPDRSAARINLGLALARQGRSAAAIAELREAVERDAENPEAHHVLAAILASSGRIREAAAEFEEVLRLHPGHAQARAFLARAKGSRM
jgi:Flp pilus assembly protein TadD